MAKRKFFSSTFAKYLDRWIKYLGKKYYRFGGFQLRRRVSLSFPKYKFKEFQQSGVGAITLLILFSLIAGSVILVKRNSFRPKVPSGVPILSFTVDPAATGPGQNFDLVLKVNPNQAEFHAFELYLSYDPLKADFQEGVNLSANIASSYPLIISTIDPSTKIISVVGTRLRDPFIGNEDVEIARIKMKRMSGTSGGLPFSWGENTKLGDKLTLEKSNSNF